MKIAIQGHPTRGKEVIQILESLGGENGYDQSGSNKVFVYYITNAGLIYSVTQQHCSNEHRIYTLEEFEKAFPFKAGDKVTDYFDGEIGTITNLIYINNELFYNVDFINSGQAFYASEHLKPYKEMKEERNITLTLEKAKEWYKKGGELKEVALQAYSEEELSKIELPKSWVEFCNKYPVKDGECYTGVTCGINQMSKGNRDVCLDKNVCPSQKSAEAHLAMIQLEQLRNCWWNGWKSDWNDEKQTKYCIVYYKKEFKISICWETRHFLSFPTKEMAEEFLECFRDLIEKAGDLI